MKAKKLFLSVMLILITLNLFGQIQNTKTPGNIPEYAPYVDVSLWPSFDISNISTTGICIYTLAFVVDDEHTAGLNPRWGGYTPYDTSWYQSKIASLRNSGGKIIVSFGGANGRPLAYVAQNDNELQLAYKQMIDDYSLNSIDFDIEGMFVAHHESIDRRSRVMKLLQNEYPQLKISLTLPVMPFGLTNDGLYVVNSAVSNNVNLSVVNLMAMDYGGAGDMGNNAISAMNHVFSQLKNIFNNAGTPKPDAEIWKMIGVTPMIGKNDVPQEFFYLDDAVDVRNFAFQKNIGRISIWSANRDHQCDNANDPLYACSHIAQNDFEFSRIFQQDGSISYCDTASINENSWGNNIEIYPNPAKDFISVSGNISFDMEIIGIDGKLLKKIRVTEKNRKVNISDLKIGTYLLKLTNGPQSVIKKIVIQR